MRVKVRVLYALTLSIPRTLDGQRSCGAVHVLPMHTPYMQSDALRQDAPIPPVRLRDDVALVHLVFESPMMPAVQSVVRYDLHVSQDAYGEHSHHILLNLNLV